MPVALIVEDEPNTISAMAELVQREGFTASTASTLAEARTRLEEQPPDVILVDLQLPDGQGLEQRVQQPGQLHALSVGPATVQGRLSRAGRLQQDR